MGGSDLPQRSVRQRGGRGICSRAGMCGPRTGVTPGHDTGREQDRIRELEMPSCWSRDTQGLLACMGTGRFGCQLGQHSLDWVYVPAKMLLWAP